MSENLFGGTGGYFWLDSWVLANIVQLGTQRFCRLFLNRTNDPCGRQYDQMTQAARSGCANNAEGSARRATSRETEMKLTDVARSSLAELAGDYINWLLQKKRLPWRKDAPEARAVYAVRLDKPDYGEDVVYDACAQILAQQAKFAGWLESQDDEIMANVLLILIARVINMLNHQMESQGRTFEQEGGFREKLTQVRVAARALQEDAPPCPPCGRPTTRRTARQGKNAGRDFWGCTGYPECKGVLAIESVASDANDSNDSIRSNPSSSPPAEPA
ncbi:MAG: four helix bundle suffix domain-containing protein [Candidatus Marinimicrobia bacterium]|nr:four helix bundle suffix domain-containing protein [Candidatus Neomarinimicrobiota bacterium]